MSLRQRVQAGEERGRRREGEGGSRETWRMEGGGRLERGGEVESGGRGRWFERARIIFAEEKALPLFVVAEGTEVRIRGG